jgi:predicted MPP superfamily phosphohydrolase
MNNITQTIHKIAWLTDIHLNFLKPEARRIFYQKVTCADAVLITGDISEAPSICEFLEEFSAHIDKDIYFVLGNHDYYLGNVIKVRREIKQFCNKNKKLHWLGKPEIVKLSQQTILIGHDGWADARYGDFDHSFVVLNDSRYIAELFQASCMGKTKLKQEMQKLADADATVLATTLEKAITKYNPKRAVIATHVPPYKECAQYRGQPSDENWQPFYSSKATGDVISAAAKNYPAINFLVLCGHTHTKYVMKLSSNLEVRVGGAKYYQPDLQEIITI